MKIFIELWKAKDTWKQLPVSERQAYVAQIGPVMEDLMKKGVVIEAWGINEDETPFAADFDFFAVTKLPNQELLDQFETIVEGAGWYNYFDQINVSGSPMTPEEVIGKMLAL
jgi:hypothetical protein